MVKSIFKIALFIFVFLGLFAGLQSCTVPNITDESTIENQSPLINRVVLNNKPLTEEDSLFSIGTLLSIKISAKDVDGDVTNVKILFNNQIKAQMFKTTSDTSKYFSCNLETAFITPGKYEIKIVAADNNGKTKESNYSIKFTHRPICSFISLADSSCFSTKDYIQVDAKATDQDGSVKYIELYVDYQLVEKITTPTVFNHAGIPNEAGGVKDSTMRMNYTIKKLSVGNHKIRIRTEDNYGMVDYKELNLNIFHEANNLLDESFESFNVLPNGWNCDSTGVVTWKNCFTNSDSLFYNFKTINFESLKSITCSTTQSTLQREKLISPTVMIPSSKTNVKLVFYAGFNSYRNDNQPLSLYISQDNGVTWDGINSQNELLDKPLWISQGDEFGWKWRQIRVDLNKYKGKTIKLCWKFFGINSHLVALDDIRIISN